MVAITYEGKKYNASGVSETKDVLTSESALQINVNGSPFTITMRTPEDDMALVRGLLHSEGVIKGPMFAPEIILSEECDNVVSVADVCIPEDQLGSGYSNSRNLLSVSSCGICGKTELEDIAPDGETLEAGPQVEAEAIQHMFETMRHAQQNFEASGGCHAAAAFDESGHMLTCKEDIGRHNAVDKVVGELLLQKQWKKAAVLTVSGRISYEIIVKTFKARIPVLCAVSAPSSLAVDFAKELGITLLAFCRNDRATCYAHPERIISTKS